MRQGGWTRRVGKGLQCWGHQRLKCRRLNKKRYLRKRRKFKIKKLMNKFLHLAYDSFQLFSLDHAFLGWFKLYNSLKEKPVKVLFTRKVYRHLYFEGWATGSRQSLSPKRREPESKKGEGRSKKGSKSKESPVLDPNFENWKKVALSEDFKACCWTII